MEMFDRDLFGEPAIAGHKSVLAQTFEYPPFSVLNAREGWWQERKRQWLALGIQSEVGRGAELIPNGGGMTSKQRYEAIPGGGKVSNVASLEARRACPGGHSGSPLSAYTVSEETQSGTSIFDPVLTELAYRWFCPPGGHIIDPFAGGSVRGIVASVLGYTYTGHELRPEQVAANREQAGRICPESPPHWVCGDSAQTLRARPARPADFLFSCPPYGDLEVYSDHAADLSAMPHEGFLAAYRDIIAAGVASLRPDRFAAFVVGDFRCKRGFYRNFVGETVSAFEAAGARFYNEAILVTAVGSLPVRVSKQFKAGRKLGKTHQNMLVFCNGDPKRATAACEGAAA